MSLPRVPNISTIGTLVTRILGQNPGPMTLQGTNSYLVGYPKLPRILIDTTSREPGLTDYLHHLSEALSACTEGCPLAGIILTHWHPDHTQAVSAVVDLARQLTRQNNQPEGIHIPVYKYPGGPSLSALRLYNGPLIDLHQDTVIPIHHDVSKQVHSVHLRVLHTPGHTDDHVCLLLESECQAINLFTGDLILGHGSTTVQNLPSYMNSLARIRDLVFRCERDASLRRKQFILCPAHGLEVVRSGEKVDEYVNNRRSRIAKTREFLLSNPVQKWLSEDQILDHVYPDVNDAVALAARLNLRHSLFWLAAHTFSSDELQLDLIAKNQCGEHVDSEQFQALLARLDDQYQSGQKDVKLLEKLVQSWQWRRQV